jgi:hypothetical protein
MYSVEIKNNKEIYDFCMVNGITDINKFIQDCFKQGFDLKKYGLLGEQEKRVEIPVEVIKEVEKIVEVTKEIPVDRVVEVIKEVPVEVIKEVIKEVPVETIKEVEVIKYVDREIIKEVRVEAPVPIIDKIGDEPEPIILEKIIEVEKIVEKIVEVEKPNDKTLLLQETLQTLKKELSLKNSRIEELEEKNKQLESNKISQGAVYLKGSNINETI